VIPDDISKLNRLVELRLCMIFLIFRPKSDHGNLREDAPFEEYQNIFGE
jgi:hypothetical protein